MQIMKSKLISKFLEWIMVAIMAVGGIIMIILPFIIRDFVKISSTFSVYNTDYSINILMGFLYAAGIIAEIIIYNLRKIFRLVNLDTPFCRELPKRLRRLGILILLLSLATLIKFILLQGFFSILLVFLLGLACLCMVVLAEVFDKAVDIKEENDLTI